jgi:NAD-dependent deacetylase
MTLSDVEKAAGLLRNAHSVLVLTGAGISAESGVPTFRGAEGLWRDFRPEDLATSGAFARDPRLVWEWYGWRREVIGGCRPNAAHEALAGWQRRRPNDVWIATQNVDGLHALASREAREPVATPPEAAPLLDGAGLLEIHGTLFATRCTVCGERRANQDPIDATSIETLPSCDTCAGLLRPDVVWFGEALDAVVIGRAFEWAEQADVCLVIGTSALVHPAASLPAVTAESGGTIIEVNPSVTPLTGRAAVSLRGDAAAILPDLVR